MSRLTAHESERNFYDSFRFILQVARKVNISNNSEALFEFKNFKLEFMQLASRIIAID